MSSEKPNLTIKDPIPQEVLHRLSLIQNSRKEVGDQLIDLELEKIKLLVAARQLDDEKTRMFAKELTDRGLSSDAPVEVDGKTGVISLLIPPKS